MKSGSLFSYSLSNGVMDDGPELLVLVHKCSGYKITLCFLYRLCVDESRIVVSAILISMLLSYVETESLKD